MDVQSFLEYDKQLLLFFNDSNNLFADHWMTILTCGFTWIPLYISLLLLIVKNNETMSQILLIVGCALLCVLLSDGMADFIVKPLVGRWRPCNDPVFRDMVHVVNGYHGTDYGFFSAHAANTFSIAVFLCLLVKSRLLSVALVVWSLTNCYTRMYLGLHYPGDIIAGLAWGGLVGTCVYFMYLKIFRKISAKNDFISSQYTSSGYNLIDVDVVLLVLILTLLYSIIRALFVF
jgi:undecaprenyl-diphosphatase